MTFVGIFFILVALVFVVWLLFGVKKMRHKFLSFFFIALILFAFFSFTIVFKGKEISIKNMSDLGNMFKIYFSWIGNLFGNIKIITGQAVNMNWEGNQTSKLT